MKAFVAIQTATISYRFLPLPPHLPANPYRISSTSCFCCRHECSYLKFLTFPSLLFREECSDFAFPIWSSEVQPDRDQSRVRHPDVPPTAARPPGPLRRPTDPRDPRHVDQIVQRCPAWVSCLEEILLLFFEE